MFVDAVFGANYAEVENSSLKQRFASEGFERFKYFDFHSFFLLPPLHARALFAHVRIKAPVSYATGGTFCIYVLLWFLPHALRTTVSFPIKAVLHTEMQDCSDD